MDKEVAKEVFREVLRYTAVVLVMIAAAIAILQLTSSDESAGKVMKMQVHADGTSCYWIKGQDGIWCMPAPCKHHIKSTEPR